MKKNVFIICFISLTVLICSSFKTDRIQPNNSSGKDLEISHLQNGFNKLISDGFFRNELEIKIQSDKKRAAGLIKPYQVIIDTVTAMAYEINTGGTLGDYGERVFYFSSLGDHGLPGYLTVKVFLFNTSNETLVDSKFEYNINEVPDGSYYYWQYAGNSFGAGSHRIYAVLQQIVPPTPIEWEIDFNCQAGLAYITLYRTN